jgi:uncharacterized phage protein (TIGR02220 family)
MTETNKWDDKWFRARSKEEKILFLYLTDKCDNAGFWEIDIPIASIRTGLTHEEIEGALKGLTRGLIAKGETVWLKNFLYHQKNLPLNQTNRAHRQIIELLRVRSSEFPEVLDLPALCEGASKPLARVLGKGIGKGKGKGQRKRQTGGDDASQEDDIEGVVELLNELSGSKYRATTEATAKVIRARLDEGHSVEDLKLVVRFKCSEWLNDQEMSKYLRPETLFRPSKFEGYLSAAARTPTPENEGGDAKQNRIKVTPLTFLNKNVEPNI